MTDTLEPCPWCGEQPVVTDDADDHYELMCSCPLSGTNASTSCAGIDRNHAEERWNKLSASVRAAEETKKVVEEMRLASRYVMETPTWNDQRWCDQVAKWADTLEGKQPPRVFPWNPDAAARSSGARGGAE